MYPNGYNSWCWAPLGYLFATNGGNTTQKYNGTPTLWFNAASAGSAMVDLNNELSHNYNAWSRSPGSENSVYAKLGNTLRNFGSVYGAKAVLWTQGETDAARLWINNATDDNIILDNYTTELNKIIGYSREAATGLTNHSLEAFKNLNWFISKTSLFPTPDGTIGANEAAHLSEVSINNSVQGFVSDPIRTRQVVNATNKVFQGPLTDSYLNRATGAKIHFTGSTLQSLANEWYSKITSVYESMTSVLPAEPLGFSAISKSGSNYTLTVNNSIGGTHFFWQKNNDANMRYPHIGSPLSNETTSNTSLPLSASPGDVLHCYVFKNGRFHPVAPYVVPGTSEPLKILNADKSSLNFSPSGGSQQVRVIYENISWQVDSKPPWLTES
ncbi:MAG: hypothetical protein LRY55_00100 [Leadbetterella sp.]|nr:hypothetical protein [Leadbetterella sp.]